MHRYAKSHFERADEAGKATLAAELSQLLAERMRSAPEFHAGVRALVEELRNLGHDLWSFDESDEMEAWCPDYHTPRGSGIVVTFAPSRVEVVWLEPREGAKAERSPGQSQ